MKIKMFCYGASISCTLALTSIDQFLFLALSQAAVSQTLQLRTWILLQGRNCFLKFMSFFICRIISFKALFIDLNIYHPGEAHYKVNFGISLFLHSFFFSVNVLELLGFF
jgi:hypothetical protein